MTVEWRPDTSRALIHTLDRSRDSLQLITTCILQQEHLSHDFCWLHVLYTDGLFSSTDIHSSYNGMAVWPRRDCNLYLRIRLCKIAEMSLDVCAEIHQLSRGLIWHSLPHASTASSCVTVMKVEPLALQDPGADAILHHISSIACS